MRKQARRFVLAAGLVAIPALAMAADEGAKARVKGLGNSPERPPRSRAP
ncbi:hypothetical protein NR798_19020 [Archangium gephyra]